jgi:hypothetical protein
MDIYVNAAAPNDQRKARDFTENCLYQATYGADSIALLDA